MTVVDRFAKGSVAVIRSVEIKLLRGIREGRLDDLTPLTVLVGPNGSGKSTVLEALMIGTYAPVADAVIRMVDRRWELDKGIRWLHWMGAGHDEALIKVITASGSKRLVQLSVLESAEHVGIQCVVTPDKEGPTTVTIQQPRRDPAVPPAIRVKKEEYRVKGQEGPPLDEVRDVRFIDLSINRPEQSLDQLYTEAAEAGRRHEVFAIARDLLPTLEDIEILAPGGQPVLYLSFANRSVPAALAGDGIRLILRLAFELAARKKGLVLIEEPEIHMHPGAIRQVARVLVAAVRREIQVVLTTHSLELIDALMAASSAADLDQLSLFQLKLDAGILKSSHLSGPEVASARSVIEDDLR